MDERQLNVIIGMAFRPGDAVNQAASTADKIQDIFRRIGQGGGASMLPPQMAENFGRELRRHIEKAVDIDLRNSNLFQSVRPVSQQLLTNARADQSLRGNNQTDPARFAAEIGRLAQARLAVQEFTKQAKKPLGEPGGFPNATARTMADLRVHTAEEAAADSLAKAKKNYAEAIKRSEAQDQARMNSLGREIIAIDKRTAAAREASAQEQMLANGQVDRNGQGGIRAYQEALARETMAITGRTERDLAQQRQIQEARAREIMAIHRMTEQGTKADRKRQEDLAALHMAPLPSGERDLNLTYNTRQQDRALEYAKAREIMAVNGRTERDLAEQRRLQGVRAREIMAITGRGERDSRMEQQRLNALGREIVVINQRTDAARRTVARQQAADSVMGEIQLPFANPNLKTPVGMTQFGVNMAQLGLEGAQRRLARVLDTEGRSDEQVIAANRSVETAKKMLAQAQLAEAKASERALASAGGGGRGGFGSQFATGFNGRGDRPYAEQIGQAFKFSLFYGTAYKLLFALTATFQATLQEGIAFQQAVSELKLAAGDARENVDALADNLGKESVAAGFAPSQGVVVGARAVGLYGAQQSDQETQDRVAEISTRVVSRLAFNSGKQPEELQTNIAAITNAFGGGMESQYRVADLDAYFSQRFGVPSGETIAAVSESGAVGKAAGFNMEEVNAIAALLMGRTGQTSSAVAGHMAQIFSRGGEGSLTNVASKYGIDPTLELADQIKGLSEVYKTATPQAQAEIAASLGRGKVQNSGQILLANFDDVLKAAQEAATDSGGSADKTFDERMRNVGGQIQLTTAVLKDFAHVLGDSGVLSVLGAGILVLREVTEAGTGLLRLWNLLDSPMKATVAGLVALAAASTYAARASAAGTIGDAIGAGRLGLNSAPGVLAGGLGTVTRGGVAVPLASRAGAGALAANALGTLVNPATIAIGGLLAIGALKNTSDELSQAQKKAADALNLSALPAGSTPDAYRARAAELSATATDTREGASGLMAKVFEANRRDALTSAGALEAEAARLIKLADAIEARQNAAPDASAGSFIKSFDPDGLKQSMELITLSGGTAREQLDALNASLRGTADAAAGAAAQFDPKTFSKENAAPLMAAITGSLPKDGIISNAGFGLNKDAAIKELQQRLGGDDIAKSLMAPIEELGSLGDITEKEASRIASEMLTSGPLADAFSAGEIGEGGNTSQVRKRVEAAIREYLLAQAEDTKQVLTGDVFLNPVDLGAFVENAVASTAALLDSMPQNDFSGRVAEGRALVRSIRQAVRQSDGATPTVLLRLGEAERALAEAQFNEMEALRKVAQQNATGKREVARIGRRFLRQELRAAVAGGNTDLLATIIGQAGSAAIGIARAIINDAINTARAANEVRLEALRLQREAQSALSDLDFVRGGQSQGVKSAGEPFKDELKVLETTIHAGKDNVYKTGSDARPDDKGAAEKVKEEQETAAQRGAAQMAANAARSGGSIDAARADMYAAKVAMNEAEKGSVAYFNALGQFYSARNSLTEAISAFRQNRYLLGIDMTDPLAMATAGLRAARDKLRDDRGKSQEVRDQDRIDLRNAQAEQEATKFQQRLDAVQTAEQLGQTSHRAYMNYLEREHNRLNRIKDRTYQQQQQLNQIDGLLQEAASAMSGQWNFGDIKLPTGYQVRRHIEENFPRREVGSDLRALSAGGGAGGGTHVTNNFRINGADTAMVKAVIRQAVGEFARTTSTKPRHG